MERGQRIYMNDVDDVNVTHTKEDESHKLVMLIVLVVG
jgi:hypothetical protein